jgi:alanine racemase
MLTVHVKIDTGMGRLGFCSEHVINDIIHIASMEGIELVGLMSHFSDADLSDRSFASMQLKKFNVIRKTLCERLNRKTFSHIANSAAVLNFEDAHLDAVRPGLMLYGYNPLCRGQVLSDHSKNRYGEGKEEFGVAADSGLRTHTSESITLIPAMRVKTKILFIRNLPPDSPISYGRTFITKRNSRIGVLPLGYADGYNRLFSNNGVVLVRGRRMPVVGRVCMDLTMVDLTEIEDVREGDEVVIMGQQGDETITAHELAQRAQTIPYEILTSLGSHSKKEFIHNFLHSENTGAII